MLLVACNRNVMVSTSQQLISGLIRRDNQISPEEARSNCQDFFGQDLSQKFPFFNQLTQYPCLLFSTFHWKFDSLKVPKKICTWLMLLCIRTIFYQSKRLHFFIKTPIDKFQLFNAFEMRNQWFYCSQRKLGRSRISKLSHGYGFSWDSNSSVSKTNHWTSSIKVRADNFICV